ncbi:SMC family ATPase [Rhodocaloribacter litoris]|uniref:AAA family ATPase n=1 Tax=Rhodocaloribacter litoris TaxID=2558931 RepID=UPI00142489F1|nr:SMC family ATPase [Rhodocaloribacter litoris]QXD15559.1 SMC family ATPase [Rhodocaloribacter litoris]
MVPVALRLHNFLSYGTAAPTLDFEQFRVACLSGRNGQGKSALLDAITWALWGEARKSSDSRKPDDDLLRIGARRMQVELVFDLEGTRYRVLRWYEKTKTGKTSKPGLEVHVFDPAQDDYRPLTGASIRETQQVLNNILGLDYDTFINSAFLLQGRSDEFTKKRPAERKQILARILNLGRYDRLAEMARERLRKAEADVDLAEREIERLKNALAGEPAWKEEHARVEAQIAEEAATLERLRAEERQLAERLAALEARAQEALTTREALDGLDRRRHADEEERRQLLERIREADALIARQAEIEREHQRYETLRKTYDDLLDRQHLYEAVEKQIRQQREELKDRKNALENQIHRLTVELKADRDELSRCEAELVELPAVRRQLEAARTAARQFKDLTDVLTRRRRLEEEITAAEQRLMQEREALGGRLHALEAGIEREAATLPDPDGLEQERQACAAAVDRHRQLQEALDRIRQEGQALREQIREREGLMKARQESLKKQEEALRRLLDFEEEACPTCGTPLTPAHRAEVEARYRTEMDRLRKELEEMQHGIEEKMAARQTLLDRYRAVENEARQLADRVASLAAIEQRIAHARTAQEALAARRKEAEALRRRLADEDFGHEVRARLQTLRERLDACPFDEAAYERLRDQAGQVERFEEKLRRLEEVAGRKQQLEQRLQRKEPELETLRTRLDDGSVFGPIQEQIRHLEARQAEIGFDPARLEEVRRMLREVEKAGERMKELLHARANRADWKEQVARIDERLARAKAEREALAGRLTRLEADLAGRDELVRRQRELAAACAGREQALSDLHTRAGELRSRLEQARQDREALTAQRKAHAAARTERTIYRHLRAAFGKHGIPSLIIEQTLPEIEERANELLARLTDGKMYVHLETLKDKKTGGTKETLEIIITDEQGVPRPYETFSGGEAFRVNFALRIALAQLLAERSGVRVRTLVVDEGFGTQDEQGVENMVEAIQTIQDDFDKIIVITHLDQLKEAFPVRIEVEKDPVEGSRFQMIGV